MELAKTYRIFVGKQNIMNKFTVVDDLRIDSLALSKDAIDKAYKYMVESVRFQTPKSAVTANFGYSVYDKNANKDD